MYTFGLEHEFYTEIDLRSDEKQRPNLPNALGKYVKVQIRLFRIYVQRRTTENT